MQRPNIKDFFPESTTLDTINKAFLAQPSLYAFIAALDAYVDWLETNQAS